MIGEDRLVADRTARDQIGQAITILAHHLVRECASETLSRPNGSHPLMERKWQATGDPGKVTRPIPRGPTQNDRTCVAPASAATARCSAIGP